MTDAGELLEQRAGKHGDFTLGAKFTQDVMDLFTAQANWRLLEAFQKEGVHMIVHKMQRIMTGQHDFDDHWLDIEGYARCVREHLHLVRERHSAIVTNSRYNDLLIDIAAVMGRQPNWDHMRDGHQPMAMNILKDLASFISGRESSYSAAPWLDIEERARFVFNDLQPKPSPSTEQN